MLIHAGRDQQALELRLGGRSYREIAGELRFADADQAYRAVCRAIRHRALPDHESVLREDEERRRWLEEEIDRACE